MFVAHHWQWMEHPCDHQRHGWPTPPLARSPISQACGALLPSPATPLAHVHGVVGLVPWENLGLAASISALREGGMSSEECAKAGRRSGAPGSELTAAIATRHAVLGLSPQPSMASLGTYVVLGDGDGRRQLLSVLVMVMVMVCLLPVSSSAHQRVCVIACYSYYEITGPSGSISGS
eukprot:COSAG01_NODE_12862_length_1673_cov_1.682338_1_plen_177_part_00